MDLSNLSFEQRVVEKEVRSSTTFDPINRTKTRSDIPLPDELWITVLESACTFPPEVFSGVMLNLIKNPNVTSSHLFRADIFYDSEKDQTFAYSRGGLRESSLAKHLKAEYRPREYRLPGYDLARTIVRQLIPRNPQLDKALVQTCDFFNKIDESREYNAVRYTPHILKAEDMPFYHPDVAHLAFTHRWQPSNPPTSDKTTLGTGSISISYCLFPDTTLTTKLERTALRLLQTIHKHGQGQLAGYEKRVHLDQIIPQKRYQDTYSRLKAKYGKHMSEQWVEVTDPGKHVFEDIGIAAFLIELWRDMYRTPDNREQEREENGHDSNTTESKLPFPGFVDIGCGNGVLVYILLSEGYEGRGFDARERKTWHIFPTHVRQKLQRQILVPEVFQSNDRGKTQPMWKNGIFDPGTFIISNHADELTAWTPLLAYLNESSFIAIPCCSHDLAGSRFRAPLTTKRLKDNPIRLPQQNGSQPANSALKNAQAAETGSLKRTEAQKKVPSAYSSLCSYIVSLADEVGYTPEKDVLRIPSTRNHCIVGRHVQSSSKSTSQDGSNVRKQQVVEIVERELRTGIETAGADWIQRAQKLSQKPGSGH